MVHFQRWHRGALTDFHFNSSAALSGTSLIHSLAVVLSWVRLGHFVVHLREKTPLNLPVVRYSLTDKCAGTCDEPDCHYSCSDCRWRSGSRRSCWGQLEEGCRFCTTCKWAEVSQQHHCSPGRLVCPSSPKMEFCTQVQMEALRDIMFRFQQIERIGSFSNVAIMKASDSCLIWRILLEYYKHELWECNKGRFLPRTVSVTLTSPNWSFPETSQSNTPLSLRVTLENLRLLPYIVNLLEYGSERKKKNVLITKICKQP